MKAPSSRSEPDSSIELISCSQGKPAHRFSRHSFLAFSEREIVGVIGPNGSGKTTTFNVVTALVNSASGSLAARPVGTG
jgi:ABC-type multidrug transport system ATPase subunit